MGGGSVDVAKKVKKHLCHSGESVSDITFIRTIRDAYLK